MPKCEIRNQPMRGSDRSYPVLSVDATDMITEFLDWYDIDQFVQDFIGHERFLLNAVKAIKETYASSSCDPAVHKARGELAEFLGQKYLKACGEELAFKVSQLSNDVKSFVNASMEMANLRDWLLDTLDEKHHERIKAVFKQVIYYESVGGCIGSTAWTEHLRAWEKRVDDSIKAGMQKAEDNTLPLELIPEHWQVTAMYECNAGCNGGWGVELSEAGCLPPIIKAYAKTPREAMLAAIAQINAVDELKENLDG